MTNYCVECYVANTFTYTYFTLIASHCIGNGGNSPLMRWDDLRGRL